MKNIKFPKEVIIGIENDDPNHEYFVLYNNVGEAAQMGRKKRAGIYVLKRLITISAEPKITAT